MNLIFELVTFSPLADLTNPGIQFPRGQFHDYNLILFLWAIIAADRNARTDVQKIGTDKSSTPQIQYSIYPEISSKNKKLFLRQKGITRVHDLPKPI